MIVYVVTEITYFDNYNFSRGEEEQIVALCLSLEEAKSYGSKFVRASPQSPKTWTTCAADQDRVIVITEWDTDKPRKYRT